jgi:hypothetical protein
MARTKPMIWQLQHSHSDKSVLAYVPGNIREPKLRRIIQHFVEKHIGIECCHVCSYHSQSISEFNEAGPGFSPGFFTLNNSMCFSNTPLNSSICSFNRAAFAVSPAEPGARSVGGTLMKRCWVRPWLNAVCYVHAGRVS